MQNWLLTVGNGLLRVWDLQERTILLQIGNAKTAIRGALDRLGQDIQDVFGKRGAEANAAAASLVLAGLSPDGKTVAAAWSDDSVRIHPVDGPFVEAARINSESPPRKLAVGDDGLIVVGGDTGLIDVVSVAGGAAVSRRRLLGEGTLLDLDLSDEGNVVAASFDGGRKALRAGDLRLLETAEDGTLPVTGSGSLAALKVPIENGARYERVNLSSNG
jgi:hypothetical protein